MATSHDSATITVKPTVPWYRDRNARAIAFQILALSAVILLGWYLVSNTMHNMATRNIATGWSFLGREAGFGISEHVIEYSPADSYGRAILVGFLNTIKVAVIGIVLATIIGVIVGLARLSPNWLVARMATVYVESLRNVPLLLQLIIWYGLIIAMPGPRQAVQMIPGVFLTGRGVYYPSIEAEPVHTWMAVLFLVGIALTWGYARWAKRRQDETGNAAPLLLPALGFIVGLPLVAWLVAGAPLTLGIPELKGFNFAGGSVLSPEFAAMVVGLSTYTGAFIAEVVRSGIQAVSHGQTEAARALGLRPMLVTRLVVFPQSLRVIVPPLTSQYLNLTKNSSLAVAIGYPDLVSTGNTALNQTGQAVECIAIIMGVYLAISLAISLFMNWYNKHIALVER
ncbi:MAG: amino acid ABC transporter permease [Alphaproteobacteria bacterium]|jgi:general L-amino acid transport system permease protein|nr:amino acid ABC transporter permease [Alphaproteobacteria bacterium]